MRWEPETPANAVIVVRAQTGVTLFVTDELPPGVLTLVHTSDADDQNVQVSLDELLVQWPTKPLRGRSVQFRVPTASEALAPERAVGGYQRPFGGPNLWASAPLTEAEAWLRLDWDRPVVAREIVLVFDDDPDIELNTLHHHRDPHLVMPSLVDTYRVEIQVAGSEEWTEVATVADNRRRRRSHPLRPGMGAINAARVVVTATHGAPEARIVAFRVQE